MTAKCAGGKNALLAMQRQHKLTAMSCQPAGSRATQQAGSGDAGRLPGLAHEPGARTWHAHSMLRMPFNPLLPNVQSNSRRAQYEYASAYNWT